MNKYSITLSKVHVEYSLSRIKAILRLFVHNILFQRITCLVKPKDEIDYINYVQIDDLMLKNVVDKYIEETLTEIEKHVNYITKKNSSIEMIDENITLDIFQNVKVKGWIN